MTDRPSRLCIEGEDADRLLELLEEQASSQEAERRRKTRRERLQDEKLEIRLLADTDELNGFFCGNDILDKWLKEESIRYQDNRISKVYLAFYDGELVGYIALSTDALRIEPSDRRKLQLKNGDPRFIPALKIGRLATSLSLRKSHTGLGEAFIQFAFDRAIEMNELVGIRLLTVDAKHGSVEFYEKMEFVKAKVKESFATDDVINSEQAKSTTIMYLDVMAKKLPRWAFPKLLSGVLAEFEKEIPDWFDDFIIWLIQGSIHSLRCYIDDPSDQEINWDNPFIELQREIEYNHERESVSFGSFSEEERIDKERLAAKLASVSIETVMWAGFRDLIPHGHPLIIGPFPMDKLEGHPYEEPLDTKCIFDFSGTLSDGRKYSGDIVMAICPLTISQDKTRAYIPINIGLVFSGKAGHPGQWPNSDREEFWQELMDAFRDEAEPEPESGGG